MASKTTRFIRSVYGKEDLNVCKCQFCFGQRRSRKSLEYYVKIDDQNFSMESFPKTESGELTKPVNTVKHIHELGKTFLHLDKLSLII